MEPRVGTPALHVPGAPERAEWSARALPCPTAFRRAATARGAAELEVQNNRWTPSSPTRNLVTVSPPPNSKTSGYKCTARFKWSANW